MAQDEIPTKTEGVPYQILFVKGPLHRYVPSDGTWLGLNGHGKIIINFYNDSPPLPKVIMAETTPDGKTFTTKTPETTFETALGAVRQFEVSVTMSLEAAKLLSSTLQEFIRLGEKAEDEKKKQASAK